MAECLGQIPAVSIPRLMVSLKSSEELEQRATVPVVPFDSTVFDAFDEVEAVRIACFYLGCEPGLRQIAAAGRIGIFRDGRDGP